MNEDLKQITGPNTVIITCSSLEEYVRAAQKSQHTSCPVWLVDRQLHLSPPNMRKEILRIFYEHERPDILLVAMAHCGGVWENLPLPCRVVIPRADDCITLLLSVDDKYAANRKEMGHLYVYEPEIDSSMGLSMVRDLAGPDADESVWGDMEPDEILQLYFHNYKSLDIIDTGLFDEYAPDYENSARAKAERIGLSLTHVPGSNRILEKLVSGNWDEQFMVLEPDKGASFKDLLG